MTPTLIMYSRTSSCPFIMVAKRVLNDHHVAYHEVYIDQDDALRQRVLDWTGFLSVPTLIVSDNGSLLPISAPAPLDKGRSPRGVDRGSMITEPSQDELTRWLHKHGLINEIENAEF